MVALVSQCPCRRIILDVCVAFIGSVYRQGSKIATHPNRVDLHILAGETRRADQVLQEIDERLSGFPKASDTQTCNLQRKVPHKMSVIHIVGSRGAWMAWIPDATGGQQEIPKNPARELLPACKSFRAREGGPLSEQVKMTQSKDDKDSFVSRTP